MHSTTIVLVVICCSLLLTLAVRWCASHFGIVDHPGLDRKIHKKSTPLLGGAAVILAFTIGALIAWPALTGGYLLPKHLIGVVVGGLILLLGGALDDTYNLSPGKQIVFPILSAVVIIASGIGIEYITNPFGGTIPLDSVRIELLHFNSLPYAITLFADLFTIVWLLGMMYTTKFLDGLDGLVSGITVIGALILFFLSMSEQVNQPETALLALIAAGSFLGFLVFNWNPASIFLGESGSLFAGFILGVLAIISGGKIATALLILGIPILDVIWVIVRRFVIEKRSPFEADRKHLHLRLVDSGLSQRQAVLVLYVCTVVFGASALTLQSKEKVFALFAVGICMVFLVSMMIYSHSKKKHE